MIRGPYSVPDSSVFDAALLAWREGRASEADKNLLIEGLTSGRLVVASGAGAMAIGRDAYKPIINNIGTQLCVELTDAQFAELMALHRAKLPHLLNEIPDDLPDFTGREAEQRALLAVLSGERSHAAITALKGMGGVGKSCLAHHVARQLALDYPAAQLVVDLRGTSSEPLSPRGAMERVIGKFYPELRLPDEDEKVVEHYRAILKQRRVLLVLDNAAGAEQVRPLLPPAPSAAIITSRRLIELPEVRTTRLDVLPPLQAQDLLRRVMGDRAEGAELGELAEVCGRLPLALRVAGTFLRDHDNWSVAGYVERVKRDKTALKLAGIEFYDVMAVLGLSLAVLEQEGRELARRWEVLSVFPANFDVAGAAAVWEVTQDVAGDGLDALYARSMVLYDSGTERYYLHDLMREVARWASVQCTGGSAEERHRRLAEASDRHVRHYEYVLEAADVLYLQGGANVAAGLKLFDLERTNIEAGWAWVSRHAEEDRDMAHLCSAYANAGTHVRQLRQHPREQIGWLGAALAAAGRIGDRRREGAALGNLGTAYAVLGDARKAIDYFKQHLEIAREISDRRGEGNALGNMGAAHTNLCEFREAIPYLEQHLKVAREIGDRRGEGNALGNLGNVYWELGEARRAIHCHRQRLDIALKIGDRHGEGSALGDLGNAHLQLGQVRPAIQYYKQQLEIAREIGDRRGEGNALGSLGNAYFLLGEVQRAIDLHEQHLKVAREIGDRLGEGKTLGNLGNAYRVLGEARRAIEYCEQCLGIAREVGDRQGEGTALFNSALAFHAMAEPAVAAERMSQAADILESLKHPIAAIARAKLHEWKGGKGNG